MAPSSTLSLLLAAAALPGTALAASSLFVSHYNGNLYSLALSDAGKLSITGSTKGAGQMPSWLSIDSAGKTVYCTDEATGGSPVLNSYSIDSSDKLSLKVSAKSPGGELHATLYGGSDGKGYIAAAEYDPGSIVTFKLPLTSSSSSLSRQHFTISKTGPNAQRQNAAHPHSTYTDPTGKYVLSNDLGADLVRVFSIGSAGQLTLCASAATAAGDGPRHGDFWVGGSSNLTMLYTVNELSNSVTSWSVSYAGSCMGLTRKQTILNYPSGKSAPSGSKSAEVHVKGNFVYVVNRNDKSFGSQQDSVATYAIDTATGAISQIDFSNAYSFFPRTFQINAAGDMVAFGGQTSSNVAIVARNTTTGKLGSLIASLVVGSPGSAGNEDGLSAVIWNE